MRISRWHGFGGEQGPFTPVLLLGLVVALAVHDLISRRRLHSSTMLGVSLLVLTSYGTVIARRSEVGRVMIRQLR
ncbi:MAG: hypothetical protein ACRD4E_13265 [Bryobacteraceae bacterium]